MRPALQVPQRLANLLKRKYPVNHRSQLVQRDRSIHRLEHLPAANEDALDADALHQDRHGIDRAATARQDADQADLAARAHGAERLAERSGAADLDDVIDADAAGQFAGAIAPLRRRLVVDAVGRAELLDPLQLLVAARRGDDAGTEKLGE